MNDWVSIVSGTSQSKHSGDATERAGFAGMGVNHSWALSPEQSVQSPQRLQVGERTDGARHCRNVGDLHAALFGVVGHVAFLCFDLSGNEPSAPRPVIEGGG